MNMNGLGIRLVVALLCGFVIGLERQVRGKPVGIRTSMLICMGTMLFIFLGEHINDGKDSVRILGQVVTGIGFLGAGVIVREGLSVRGLTTAASIWITAAIGILVGIGFFLPAALATAATLGTLSAFRWIEARMASELYAHFRVQFQRDTIMAESDLRGLIVGYGFSIANLNYALIDDGSRFEYRMVLRTVDPGAALALSNRLRSEPTVVEFRISQVDA